MPKKTRSTYGTGSPRKSILSDGRVRWSILVYDDAGKRRTSPRFDSKAEALDWAHDFRKAQKLPVSAASSAGVLTFGAAASIWLGARDARESLMSRYRSTLDKHLLPLFADRPLDSITEDDLHAYIDAKLTGSIEVAPPAFAKLSRGTISGHIAQVRSIYAYASSTGKYKGRSPADTRSKSKKLKIKADPKKPKALGTVEYAKLVAALPEAERPMGSLLCMLGLRFGEATVLRWRDWQSSTVVLERALKAEGSIEGFGKTPQAARSLKCSPQVNALLRELYRSRKAAGVDVSPDALIFWPDGVIRDHRYWSRRVLQPAAKTAMIGHVTPHMLRHTFAQNQINAGVDIARISRMMGHATPGFTLDRYIHFMDRDAPSVAGVETDVEAARRRARAKNRNGTS